MRRGIFGWSYPPGCSGPPDDNEGPCQVCGQGEVDCICPECPECGAFGDPKCYQGPQQHLTKTIIQVVRLQNAQELWRIECLAENRYLEEWYAQQQEQVYD